MLQKRTVSLFRNRPRLIIVPVKPKPTLLELLATFEPLDEEFPEAEDLPPEDRDLF